MIKTITFENFKGQTGSYELSGRDIFIGPNGSGKTSVQQAAALAIQGFLPGGKRKAEDVFYFSTGPEMSVGVKLQKGFEFKRTWTKKKKIKKTGEEETKIIQSIFIAPSNGENTNREKEMRIFAEVGKFAMMFDFEELNSMSDNKRREFIYKISRFDRSKFNKEYIQNFLEQKAIEYGEDFQEGITEAIKETMQQYNEIGFDESLYSMQRYLWDKTVEFKTKKTEAANAGKKLMSYKNELETTDKGLKDDRQRKAELDKKIEEISKEIGIQDTKRFEQKKQRIREIRSQERIAKYEADILRLKNELQEQPVEKPKDRESYKEHIDILKLNITRTKQDIEAIEKEIRLITKEREEIKEAKRNIGPFIMTEENRCPFNKEWECPHDIEKSNKEKQQENEKYEEILIKYNEAEKVQRAKKADSETKIAEMEALIKDFEQRDAQAKYEEQRLITKHDHLFLRIKEKEEQLKEEQKENMITENIIECLADEDYTKMEMLLAGYKSKRAELEIQITNKEEAKITLKNTMKALHEAKEGEKYFTIYNGLYKALGPGGIQGEIVKEILQPLEDEITKKIIKIPGYEACEFKFVVNSDTGREAFQYGWINKKGNLVLFPALSTSERGIVIAALLTSIIESIRLPIKMFFMDNIENFDETNRAQFINNLLIMTGKFDNVLLAGVFPDPKIEGYTTWTLNK